MIHSYTALSEWRLCPRLYHARFIEKSVEFEETPELKRGREIHGVLEAALRGKWGPPGNLKINPKFWELLLERNAKPEVKVAIKRDGSECGFFSDDAWLRGVIDVFVGGQAPLLVDWKTGKAGRVDTLQAEVYAAMLHAARGVPKIAFVFSYVLHGQSRMVRVHGKPALESVQRLIEAVESDREFFPKPSWKCGYCGVDVCEFNEGKK